MKNSLAQLFSALKNDCEQITRLLGNRTNVDGYAIKPIITSIDGLYCFRINVTFYLQYMDDGQRVRNVGQIYETYRLDADSEEIEAPASPSSKVCFKNRVGFFDREFFNVSEQDLFNCFINMVADLSVRIHDVERFNELLVTDQYLGNLTSINVISKLSHAIDALYGMNFEADSKMQLASLPDKQISVFLHDYDEHHLCLRVENQIHHHWGVAFPSILIAINKNGRYFEVYQNERNCIIDKSRPYLDYSFINDNYFCIANTPESHKVNLNNTAIKFGHLHYFEPSPNVSKYFQSNHTGVDGNILQSDEIKSLIESSIIAVS